MQNSLSARLLILTIVFVMLAEVLIFLPSGLLGLVVASLAAAYMSTISTHLNWGASYVVDDVYRRFIAPDEDEKQYVRVGRIAADRRFEPVERAARRSAHRTWPACLLLRSSEPMAARHEPRRSRAGRARCRRRRAQRQTA